MGRTPGRSSDGTRHDRRRAGLDGDPGETTDDDARPGLKRASAGRSIRHGPWRDRRPGRRRLPERLYAARERKGVDLYRAERDTKIRARYLGALERGDYKELPGAVYTKGFLRNYALYLGLDPDEVLLQWRRERGDGKEQAPAIVVPKPIATPRKGLTFSPGIVVAALLTVVVVAFGAYLGVQVLRFAKPPTIAVTQPATTVIDVDESTTRYTLMGDTLPGATISIATPGRDPVSGHRRPPTASGRPMSTCVAAGTSSTSTPSTRTPASIRTTRSTCSSPCRSSSSRHRP